MPTIDGCKIFYSNDCDDSWYFFLLRGRGSQRPSPLSTKFDDAHIATIGLDSKKEVLRSQNDYHLAKAAYQKSNQKEQAYRHEEEIAENKKKQAEIETDSAKTKIKAAKTNGDQKRINTAMKSMHKAQAKNDSAEKQLVAVRARHAYLVSNKVLQEEKMYFAEATYEKEKAKLAQANKMGPQGFSYGSFELQASDRKSRVAKARVRTQKLQKEAAIKKNAWVKSKQGNVQ